MRSTCRSVPARMSEVRATGKTFPRPAKFSLEKRLHGINGVARIHRAKNADIAIDKVLNVGGFNLDRAVEVDPQFLETEYPFEWAGAYELAPGTYDLGIGAHHHHGDHDHAHDHPHHGHEDEDAHARAHAQEIERRFAGRHVTTGQIILFGLTGGLMPCPAAVSILIVCLQLKEFSLGFGIVAAFSLGLALTMISVGVLASWGFKKLAEKSGWFSRIASRAPYVSSYLLIALGLAFAFRGLALLK